MESKKELDKLVGENIKRERVKAGLTQERFSEMIGMQGSVYFQRCLDFRGD